MKNNEPKPYGFRKISTQIATIKEFRVYSQQMETKIQKSRSIKQEITLSNEAWRLGNGGER